MTENFKQSFSIIKHYNSPDEGMTQYGQVVKREDKLWFHGRFIKCSPYDNHFIYDDKKGPWTPMCSCGAMAGIVGYDAYKQDASPSTSKEGLIPGEMIICLIHGQTGHHADGSN